MTIRWTECAKNGLAELPQKVRQGILRKADDLADLDDPEKAHKPLTGPLTNYYRLTYGRYRAVYTVKRDGLCSGDVLLNVTVLFVAVGKRKERNRDDIYNLAQRIVEHGIIEIPNDEDDEDEE